MLEKVLIANRGEIAVRVIRACDKLGIGTVAVYSEADRDSLHVRLADKAICIGPPPSRDSYLRMVNVLSAAHISGADAIHPGYGFLSENALFAEICEECGLVFIGPPVEAIRLMGGKALARETMKAADVPVVPGSEGAIEDAETALEVAGEIGYPVMVKASAGGGGKGMRIARKPDELRSALQGGQTEAENAFGDGSVYLEKFIGRARHVEIQVEHPVTEMVTGIDLVEQQLRVAAGEPLPFSQRHIKMDGHSIECRINAEDPDQDWRPCPGTIVRYGEPFSDGARMDTHLYSGYSMPPHYDSLLAKLIVHKPTREEAIEAMLQALRECMIEGLSTTIPFHVKLLEDKRFQEGQGHTKFVEEEFLTGEKPE